MRRNQLARRIIERLGQPSSAAGLAALLALTIPELAEYAPVIVDVGLMAIAICAAIVAMVRCECGSCNGHDSS